MKKQFEILDEKDERDLKKRRTKKKYLILVMLLGVLVGSFFILNVQGFSVRELFSNNLNGFVSASTEQSNPEVTRTRSTQTVCSDGKCTLTLYSGIRYAYEDEIWKEVEKARSLKDAWDVVYLNDGTHIIEVVDFNMSYIELKFSYDKDNLGEFELEVEDGKMKTKYKIIETFYNETTLLPYDVETEVEIEIEEDKQQNIIYYGNPLGKKFKLGENSTTIMLQEPDSENLNDRSGLLAGDHSAMYVFGTDSPEYQPTVIMFNLSKVPSGQNIDDSSLNVYQYHEDSGTLQQNSYEFSNHTWNEEDGLTLPDTTSVGALLDTSPTGIDPKWHSHNVTSWVSSEYDAEYTKISFALNDGGTTYHFIRAKESSEVSQRPYLNITYSGPDTTDPVVTLNFPADGASITSGVIFNGTVSDNIDIANVTLYGNWSGGWNAKETNSSGVNNVDYIFTKTLPEGTFKWNYYACDNSNNCAWGTNRTFTSSESILKWDWGALMTDRTSPDQICFIFRNGEACLDSSTIFFPAYISSHTNDTIAVASAGVFYNITFDQEVAEFKKRITHAFNDATNITFTIVDTGTYEITYHLTFEDSQASPLNHIVTRLIKNNVELNGFTIESDTTKQNADLLIHHSDLAELVAGDNLILQFTSDATTVSLTTHLSYGTHQNTGHITIKRIA